MFAVGKIDIGKKRKQNEDHIYISNDKIGSLPNVLIVADGMGGHKAGSIASEQAIEAFCHYIRTHEIRENHNEMEIALLLKFAVRYANDKVFEQATNNESCSGMGTTFTVATVIKDRIYIAHVGDTRLYLINDEKITQVTVDHSLVQEMVEQGVIEEQDMMDHPQRHIITRAVGTYKKVKIDTLVYDLKDVNYILLCSDGLTSMLNNDEIHAIIQINHDNTKNIVDCLVNTANDKGGLDNIAVIIAQK